MSATATPTLTRSDWQLFAFACTDLELLIDELTLLEMAGSRDPIADYARGTGAEELDLIHQLEGLHEAGPDAFPSWWLRAPGGISKI